MLRKDRSVTESSNVADCSNPPEKTHHDPGDDTTHSHPFPYNAVREPPAAYQAPRRKARKAAKAAAKVRRLGPKGWEDKLQAFIDKHNWRHASKDKGVSFKTKDDRATFLFSAFKTLYSADPALDVEPRNFADRHVRYLLAQWVERGLSPGTLQVYMSYLRAYCEWIRHPGMILPLEHYLSDPALATRTCVAKEDKSWIAHGVVPEEKLAGIRAYDARVACWLLLYLIFGARLKEIAMLRPHLAEVDGELLLTADFRARNCDTYLELKRGTKGGRLRWVPIDTPEKRAALEEAKLLVTSETGHLGDPMKKLAQNIRRFKYVCEKFGITKAELGITAHGLRHQYAAERYEKFSGTAAPVRGGAPVARAVDRAARLRVAGELGHARENITGAYLGGILRQSAGVDPVPATLEPKAPEAAVDGARQPEEEAVAS
jgi:integrase